MTLKVEYRQLFLKDLKKLKKQPIYSEIFDLTFTTLPKMNSLQDLSQIKGMKGYPNRYRIRVGDYRIGIEINQDTIEVMRVLHRREFYRYFP
jgi:mRNA-degrading endonuclease RelE of RelBE toxin-antitoxin system